MGKSSPRIAKQKYYFSCILDKDGQLNILMWHFPGSILDDQYNLNEHLSF